MKRYIFASILAFTASQADAGPYLDAILGAGLSNLTLEDNSREQFVDIDGDGRISAGDQLIGLLRIDSFNPPSTPSGNSMYVTFSQTFGTDFTSEAIAGGTRYGGTFSDVTLSFYEKAGGFTQDWTVEDLSSGVGTGIAAIQAEGIKAFDAVLGTPQDYFTFETQVLGGAGQPADFVVDPSATSTIPTSQILGNFSAGLSIINNNLAGVTFDKTIATNFLNNVTGINYGIGNLYQLAVVNGNFGGIFQGPGTVQNMAEGFVDNADFVLHASVQAPEPNEIALLGLGLGLLGLRRKFARS